MATLWDWDRSQCNERGLVVRREGNILGAVIVGATVTENVKSVRTSQCLGNVLWMGLMDKSSSVLYGGEGKPGGQRQWRRRV